MCKSIKKNRIKKGFSVSVEIKKTTRSVSIFKACLGLNCRAGQDYCLLPVPHSGFQRISSVFSLSVSFLPNT